MITNLMRMYDPVMGFTGQTFSREQKEQIDRLSKLLSELPAGDVELLAQVCSADNLQDGVENAANAMKIAPGKIWRKLRVLEKAWRKENVSGSGSE